MNRKIFFIASPILALIIIFVLGITYFKNSDKKVESESLNEARADMAVIQYKLQEYFNTNGAYPNRLDQLDLGEAKDNSIDQNYIYYYRPTGKESTICQYVLQVNESSILGDTTKQISEVSINNCSDVTN